MRGCWRQRAGLAGVVIAAVLTIAGTASAFDTGVHFDITQDVLGSEGFNPTSIQTVQCSNFFVDYYEFMGNTSMAAVVDKICWAKAAFLFAAADSQHFDDLGSKTAVAHKWDAMLDATRRMAEEKSKAGDVLGLLALLGMSLHNVQDFYTHSNWVEDTPWGPGLGTGTLAKYGDHPTWLSMDRADREKLEIYTKLSYKGFTRTHGDWDSDPSKLALNKDWTGRPRHVDAYICAYFATRQWVRLFRTWVSDPSLWSRMQQWDKKSFDPARDFSYAVKISFYGGHWNGNGGPGGLGTFTSYSAASSVTKVTDAIYRYPDDACVMKNPSALRAKAESLLVSWGAMPYRGPVEITLPSAAPESLQFVRLQIHSIEPASKTVATMAALTGNLDWLSRAKIGSQYFMSALLYSHTTFDFDKKPYAPWTMTKAFPLSETAIPIEYKVLVLDGSREHEMDINPKAILTKLTLVYTPLTGQIGGDISGSGKLTAEGKGDCGRDCTRITLDVNRVVASSLK